MLVERSLKSCFDPIVGPSRDSTSVLKGGDVGGRQVASQGLSNCLGLRA